MSVPCGHPSGLPSCLPTTSRAPEAFPVACAAALRHVGCVGIAGHGLAAATIREHDAAARDLLASPDPARVMELALILLEA